MTETLKDEIIALTVEAVEKAYKMGLIAGAKAEREACAKEADRWSKRDDDVGAFIGRAIRARGQV
jgi:hypothetical protein